MLQGNLSFEDPEPVLAEKFRKGYVRMADTLKPGETDLLVLPESPSPVSFQYEDSYRRVLEDSCAAVFARTDFQQHPQF